MKFRLGIENLIEEFTHRLRWQRVAILSHQAAVTTGGATSAQALRAAIGEKLVALFGPEHGFFGFLGAGELTGSSLHEEWQIPIHSLYGQSRKPTPEMLEGIDVIIVDFQDLGARCYTYLATLRRTLEAAAEADIAVMVADRPIPTANIVDGPPLEPDWRSFVADAPLPMAYGMTPGETALWLQDQLGLNLSLRVVPCRGWLRPDPPPAVLPEWLPPSPGIRTIESARCYLATVFTEALPQVDCGRGTNLAFRLLGAPWLDAAAFGAALNDEKLPGVHFYPHRYRPGHDDSQVLDGLRIAVTDPVLFKPVATSVAILSHLPQFFLQGNIWEAPATRPEFFDQLYGGPATRLALQAGTDWREIVAAWQPSLDAWQATRQRLY